jgi:hypothetical protein
MFPLAIPAVFSVNRGVRVVTKLKCGFPMAGGLVLEMTSVFVTSVTLGTSALAQNDLEVLKAAAARDVAAMNAVLALPSSAECSEVISKAKEYAAAKISYYRAALQKMPYLVEMARGEKNRYGEDLIELNRGPGEEEDEEATMILLSKLRDCESSNQERKSLEEARQMAEEFLRSLRRLERP